MAVEEDLRAGALGDEALAALIGDRLAAVESNRGDGLPRATYQKAASGRAYGHKGAVPLEGPRWQFDIYGANALQVLQVKRALIPALEALAGMVVGQTRFSGLFLVMEQDWSKQERGEGEPDSRTTLHFNIWHRPAA